MQEAFDRLIKDSLKKVKEGEEVEGLEVVSKIAESRVRVTQEELDKAQRVKRGLDLSELNRGYLDIGRKWETLRLLMPANMHWGRFRVDEEMVRGEWGKLHTQSKEFELNLPERSRALDFLAQGMHLTESLENMYRLYFVQVDLSYHVKAMFRDGPVYSPAAQVLMHAVCDLGNFDPDRQRDFYEQMYSGDLGNSREIYLNQVALPIAKYLTKI